MLYKNKFQYRWSLYFFNCIFFFSFFLMQHLLFFLGPLYPISGTTSSRSDDGSSPQIVLQRPFVYFGRSYNHIYVNHNGHLTFNASWSRYIPLQFPLHGSRDIIAPFWTDLDNRGNGQVIYNQYTNGNVLQQATQDINAYFPGLHFNANWVFVATWYQVAYYPQTTIQAVLISGGRYSFVLMNYGILAATTRNIQVRTYKEPNCKRCFKVSKLYSKRNAVMPMFKDKKHIL
uniref:NIDO domain-containing protein n=1 Tax=Seriola lalandi dorsalis TaxID=1841481 RepID=A0A3B4XIZ5_SERLL